MAEAKTKQNELSVKAFLDGIEDPQKRKDAVAVSKMMEKASGEKPKMWGTSIVGFGSYHYVYESGREGDAPRIGFSPRSAALTFYVMAGLESPKVAKLLASLGKHTTGKGCLYVKRLADVDAAVLEKLIQQTATESKKLGVKPAKSRA
ncbi:MAG: DUF1801 domain-containing protein [Labilithrix sp.]|nr:DUF1801 domain-containing protein [Labilithrix sp.]MCW5811486.1 DUF1801 domain-containing protein [Labilithrix sp.]